uniref:Uncharacterized protein n=1 Tax=Setaria italica TaxID=4555 RepID=K3ZFQ5_SETIT
MNIGTLAKEQRTLVFEPITVLQLPAVLQSETCLPC